MKRVLLPVVLLCSAAAWAEVPVASRQIEAGTTYDDLDHGYADWRSTYVEGAWNWAPRASVYGGLRETERFDRRDSEGQLGLYYPLSDRFTGVVEANASPTHRVLARWSALAQLEARVASGINLQLGARHTGYNEVGLDQGLLGGEYYIGDYRVLYTYYYSRLDGADPTGAQRVGLDYYYDERSHVGVFASGGDEAESLGAGQVILTHVRGASIAGRHWLNRHWALSYEAGRYDALDRYTRTALRLGVRYGF